jgi:hypothetical protein
MGGTAPATCTRARPGLVRNSSHISQRMARNLVARGIDEMEPLAKVRGGPRLLFRRLLPPLGPHPDVQCSAVARLSKLWCGGLCLST